MGSTGYDKPIGTTQTVAAGEDAVPPTEEDGLPEYLESEDGELLYFAYWDGDYTQVTENREIFAVYTPLVTLIAYDKTGSSPDEPVEMNVPCLSVPDVSPAETQDGAYSKAWFMLSDGEVISNTPFDLPCMEDPEIEVYEYVYTRYAEIPFALRLDDDTSYSERYTLFCSTYIGEEDEEIHFRYSLCIPVFTEEEQEVMALIDLSNSDSAGFTIVVNEIYEVPLGAFSYRISSDGEESDPLPLAELISMFENSGDEPVLIVGAEAVFSMSDVPHTE